MNFNMNILTIAALVILAFYAIRGAYFGLVRTIFSMFATIIAIAIAINAGPFLSHALRTTPVYDSISNKIEQTLFEQTEQLTDLTEQKQLIQELPFPKAIQNALTEHNTQEVYDAMGITAFQEYVADYLTNLIINAIAFVCVFIVAILLLKIVASALDLISHLPVLHTLNKLGGFLAGLVNGFIILWIIGIVITILSGTKWGGMLYHQIGDSMFLSNVYNYNLIFKIIFSLKNLLI